MPSVIVTVFVSVTCSAFLLGTYQAIKWRWPERYVGLNDTFGLSVHRTVGRVIVYRLAPAFAASATAAVTVSRLGGSLVLSFVLVNALYVGPTHLRALLGDLRQTTDGTIREVNYAGFHLLLSILLVGDSALAYAFQDSFSPAIPTPANLLTAIWSGAIAAAAGGTALSVLRTRPLDADEFGSTYFIARAERDAGLALFDYLYDECVKTAKDPVLARAILIFEVLQRPRWFRRIERLMVRLRLARTSGAMQARSGSPLSDKDSVQIKLKEFDDTWSYTFSEFTWNVEWGHFWQQTTKHNPEGVMAQQIREITRAHFAIEQNFAAEECALGVILELRRYPERLALRGATQLPSLEFATIPPSEAIPAKHAVAGENVKWWPWETPINPSTSRVIIKSPHATVFRVLRLENGVIVGMESHLIADFQEFAAKSRIG